MSAMASRPPGFSTRQASVTARARASFEGMLWMAGLPTPTAKGSSGKRLCSDTRAHDVKGAVGKRQLPQVAGLDLDSVADTLCRCVLQRHRAGISRLILGAPQIDAGDTSRRQSFRDRREHGAAPAPHVEDAFVAAKVQPVENVLPDLELAAPGR